MSGGGMSNVGLSRPTRNQFMARLLTILAIAWASPWTLCGLAAGLLALLTGGGVQRVGKVVEFHGGLIDRVLRWVPIAGGASAMTLGHCVLGRSRFDLVCSRKHELVHVAQYERWGPLFVPAYLACSVWLWLRGRDSYLDNPFEVEAYAREAE
jgi:hypothetical protein